MGRAKPAHAVPLEATAVTESVAVPTAASQTNRRLTCTGPGPRRAALKPHSKATAARRFGSAAAMMVTLVGGVTALPSGPLRTMAGADNAATIPATTGNAAVRYIAGSIVG